MLFRSTCHRRASGGGGRDGCLAEMWKWRLFRPEFVDEDNGEGAGAGVPGGDDPEVAGDDLHVAGGKVDWQHGVPGPDQHIGWIDGASERTGRGEVHTII